MVHRNRWLSDRLLDLSLSVRQSVLGTANVCALPCGQNPGPTHGLWCWFPWLTTIQQGCLRRNLPRPGSRGNLLPGFLSTRGPRRNSISVSLNLMRPLWTHRWAFLGLQCRLPKPLQPPVTRPLICHGWPLRWCTVLHFHSTPELIAVSERHPASRKLNNIKLHLTVITS